MKSVALSLAGRCRVGGLLAACQPATPRPQPGRSAGAAGEFRGDRRHGGTLGGDVHRARQGPDLSALRQLPPRRRPPAPGRLGRLHQPPVARRGRPRPAGDALLDCHQSCQLRAARMPGHPQWHLAPREMAWEGKTVGEICAQIKDPARNGGRKLEELDPPYRRRHAGRLGLGAGLGRSPRPAHRSRPAP